MKNSVISTRITSLHGSQTSPVVLCMQNNAISNRNTSLYLSQPSSVAFATNNSDFWIWHYKSLWVPALNLWLFLAKLRPLDQKYKSQWVPDLTYGFCIQNSDFSTRNASVYGTQPSSVVFACKTTAFGSELQVSMDPRSLLSFYPCKTAWSAPELLVSMGPSLHLSFCACKTTWLRSEILVSMGPSPHLLFLHTKQRL